tara:strand:- start:2127 stop:3335 length:1209 start_codon:yes stop_codon:yes gene_type:complete
MIPKKRDKLTDKSFIQKKFYNSKLSFDKNKLTDKYLVQKNPYKENIDLNKRSFIKKSVLGLAGLGGVALFSKFAKAGIFFRDDTFQSTSSTTDVTTNKTNNIISMFIVLKAGSLSVQNIVDGVVDEFEDETGVDTAASTGETYDAANDYYSNPGSNVRITGATATAPLGGTAANCNDDSTGTTLTTNSFGNLSSSSVPDRSVAKLDFGADKNIVEVILTDHWNTGGSSTPNQLWYATNAAPTTYIAYGSSFGMNATSSSDYTRTVSVTARYMYLTMGASNYGSDSCNIKKFNVYEAGTPADVTLLSNATTALAQPDEAFVVLWEEDVDSVTLNTDLIVSVSRDGGTTWTAVTLVDKATLTTGRILAASVDISAQPSGTSMKWKAVVANNKEQKIHAVGLQWS